MNKKRELLKISEEIERCRICKKWGTGKAVPGEGNPDARIVFIGEAPGRKEAETGRPFVGRSGQLLRGLLQEIGLDEKDVFITSPVKYLPFRGTPSKENIEHGRTHLLKQISVIRPDVIVLLGNTACLALIGKKVRITEEHGSVIRENGKKYFITFHPAYALRFPKGRKEFTRDFHKLKEMIKR